MNDLTDERPVATAQTPDTQSRPDITGAYQRGDMLALEMGLRAASRLTPHRLAQFKSNIEKLVARNPSRYVREWKRAIEEGPDAVRYLLTDRSDRAQVMRSVISSDRSARRKSGMLCFARTPPMSRSDIT